MGSRMALNLFSKQFASQNSVTLPQPSGTPFLVCDANLNSARIFCDAFEKQYPGAKTGVCASPAESVYLFRHVARVNPKHFSLD
jgi:3-hydroxyisobutyrate dehydrogenase